MPQHLSQELVERYRRRALSKPELIAADEHLASCGECREMLADREDLRGKIDSLRADLDKSLEEEHVDYAQLEAYVDQTLRATEREALDSHLKSCASCAKEWRDLRAFKNQLEAREILGPVGAAVSAKELLDLQGFRSQVEAREILGSEVRAGSAQPRARKMLSFGSPSAWRTGSRWALAACVLIALAIGLRSVWVWQHKPNTIVHKPETIPAPTPEPRKSPPETDGRMEVTVFGPVESVLASEHLQLPEGFADLGIRRGGDQGPSPLVSPVGIVVHSTRQVFSWNAIPGADGYRVQISDSLQNPVESSPVLTATSWTSTAILKRGSTYVWRIVILSGDEEVQESALDVPQAHFKVLDKLQSRQLQEFKRLQPQDHLALGILLAHAGVLDEAVKEFSAVPPSDPNHKLAKKLEREAQDLIVRQRVGSAQ